MKMLLRLSREAIRYKGLYIIAILSTLMLTVVNLAAPKVLSAMSGIVSDGVDEEGMKTIWILTAILLALYVGRILFRFLSNYLAHKAAWYLVGDLRTRTYDKLERMHIGYFHDKQTGDLMSRVVNDTRDFELLYAHMIPETITNLVTFIGVLAVLLLINWKLALITCAPIPLIFLSGIIFSKKVRPYFQKSQKKMGELSGKLQDNLSGIQEIQSFGREEYETGKVDEKNFEHIKAMLKALKISAIFHPSVEFISSLGTVIVVAFGGYLAWREGLDNVSFKCEAGKMLAIVGPTGVGKTTLTRLISRFYEPVSGRILIDGHDINDVTIETLRKNISPVLQDTFLFNGTIAENIGYADPDADMDAIMEAAKAANIHKDIMEMPDGYDTLVGERGLRLSGGQKQRVAISRAILRKSPIIILDEATASVDVETEKQIQEAISGISGSRTIIAIAHRLSTIRNADLIIVIEDGKISERGTHEQLLKMGGSYARMNSAMEGA